MNLRRHSLFKENTNAVIFFSAEKIFSTPHLVICGGEKRREHCQILAE
jgi:hypothetical protein